MELDYFANLQGQHDALCGDFGPHRYHLQSRVGASKSTLAGTASQILCLYLLIRFPIMTFTANVLVSSSQIKWLLDYSVRMVMFAIAISTHILTKLSLPERTDPKYCFCVARPVCVCLCLFVCLFVCVCVVNLTRSGGFVDSFVVALGEVLAKCKPRLPKAFA